MDGVGITSDKPTPPNLVGSPEALIEQAERHLRSIGMQVDDDQNGPIWRERCVLILRELDNRS